ncbi:MAG TPA: hypothetical protein VFN74_23400 [Chloroflexota bacterium]|nr:hypothetical protein [Chloroflexota bacterium]
MQLGEECAVEDRHRRSTARRRLEPTPLGEREALVSVTRLPLLEQFSQASDSGSDARPMIRVA